MNIYGSPSVLNLTPDLYLICQQKLRNTPFHLRFISKKVRLTFKKVRFTFFKVSFTFSEVSYIFILLNSAFFQVPDFGEGEGEEVVKEFLHLTGRMYKGR